MVSLSNHEGRGASCPPRASSFDRPGTRIVFTDEQINRLGGIKP